MRNEKYKRSSIIILIGMAVIFAAAYVVFRASIIRSIAYALIIIAFLRLVYYVKIFAGMNEDELVRYFVRFKHMMILFPLLYGFMAYGFSNSIGIAVVAVLIDGGIEICSLKRR